MQEDTFTFTVDEEGRAFCSEIVDEMVRRFGFPRAEAVGRVNRQWEGQALLGPDEIVYHETSEFWACDIVYGPDSYWWTQPDGLEILPFP